MKNKKIYSRFNCAPIRVVAFHGAIVVPVQNVVIAMQWRRLGIGDQLYWVRKDRKLRTRYMPMTVNEI